MEADNFDVTLRGPALWLLRGALATVLLSTAMVQAQPMPVVGGPGGAPFADKPPSGVRLGAVALRTGELIDAIAVVVVRPDGQRVPLQLHGGPGGSPRVFPLEDGEYLVAMRVWSGQVVEAIQFETNRRLSPVYGSPRGPSRRLVVPVGSEAVGFVGRAGLYWTALGSLQARAAQPPAPQNPNVGSNSPRPGSTPVAPPPAPPVSRVQLDGPVRPSRPTTSSITLQVRLKQPALLTVNLGADPPRSGQCFGPQDRSVVRYVSPRAEISHGVKFSGLRQGSNYHYSIPVDGGKCVSGIAVTATCIDTSTC